MIGGRTRPTPIHQYQQLTRKWDKFGPAKAAENLNDCPTFPRSSRRAELRSCRSADPGNSRSPADRMGLGEERALGRMPRDAGTMARRRAWDDRGCVGALRWAI